MDTHVRNILTKKYIYLQSPWCRVSKTPPVFEFRLNFTSEQRDFWNKIISDLLKSYQVKIVFEIKFFQEQFNINSKLVGFSEMQYQGLCEKWNSFPKVITHIPMKGHQTWLEKEEEGKTAKFRGLFLAKLNKCNRPDIIL